MTETRYLTVKQLAKRLGVEEGTIYHWNRKGTAPRRYRFNGGVRYAIADVEKWEQARLVAN